MASFSTGSALVAARFGPSTVANSSTVAESFTGNSFSTEAFSTTGARLSTDELFSTEVHRSPVALSASVALFSSGTKKTASSGCDSETGGAGNCTTPAGSEWRGVTVPAGVMTASTQSLLISISSRSTAKLILRRGGAVFFAFIHHHLEEVIHHAAIVFGGTGPRVIFPDRPLGSGCIA